MSDRIPDGITKTPPIACPSCGTLINAAGESPYDPNKEERPHGPVPGDFTICAYCMAVLVFNKDLGLRTMTAEEYKALPTDVTDGIVVLQFAIQQAFKTRGRSDPEMN